MFLINFHDDDLNDINYSWYKEEAGLLGNIHVLKSPNKAYVDNVGYIPQS